jgi:hypothetical protein
MIKDGYSPRRSYWRVWKAQKISRISLRATSRQDLQSFTRLRRILSFLAEEYEEQKLLDFYERQNDRLGDWIEIKCHCEGSLQRYPRVLGPRDDNGDGIAEGGGCLARYSRLCRAFSPQKWAGQKTGFKTECEVGYQHKRCCEHHPPHR